MKPPKPKIEISKDWCETMARLEDGQEIGAGSLDHPLRAVPAVTVTELRLIAKQLGPIDRDLVEAAADEIERLRTFITQNQPPAPTPYEAN